MNMVSADLRPSRRGFLAAALGVVGASVARRGDAAPAEVVVAGTGNALETMRTIAAAFMADNPDCAVIVPPSLGSSGGIRALLDGAIDVALSARPVTATEASLGLEQQLYARTPLVFVTAGPGVPNRLTLDELMAIYCGTYKTWVTGRPVRLVLRPATDSTTCLIKSLSPPLAVAVDDAFDRPGLLVASTDQENADILEQLPGSLGATALGQLRAEQRRLTVVEIPGTTGCAADIEADESLLHKRLHLVKRPQTKPAARRFIEFVNAERGRSILAATGHLPVASAGRKF